MTKRRLMKSGVPALLFACLCVLSCAAQNLNGDWTGGIDFRKSWQYANLHFTTEKESISGTIDLPEQNQIGVPIKRIVVKGPHVRLEWQGNGLAVFEGQFRGDSISGQFTQGNQKGTFGFVRVARVNPQIFEQYAGSYRLTNGRFMDIGVNNANELRYSETTGGRIGTLYPSSEIAFFSGPTVDTPFPVNVRVTFIKNRQGTVTGLTWKEGRGRLVPGVRLPHIQEAVTFRNGDATLTGWLFMPATQGPHPALMVIYPGYTFPRKVSSFPYFFVRYGIAVLTLNGKTIGGRSADYHHSSFEERARDALAGVEMLRNRNDIRPEKIGLHGSSLSSWVVPIAATLSRNVAFLILRVPSAIPVADNILYEIENDLRERDFSESDITKAKALRHLLNQAILAGTGWETLRAEIERAKNEKWFGYARVGWFLSVAIPPDASTLKGLQDPISYDPLPVLERVTVPVLAVSAELDKSVNTKESVPILRNALRKAGNKDFTILVLPKASHDLLKAKTGYNSEYVRLKGHVPGYWNEMASWLKKQTRQER